MGSSQGSRPEWEKPEMVEVDDAEDAAGIGGCFSGTAPVGPYPCENGAVPFFGCSNGSGVD
jgi:hypothetical protein